MMNSTKINSLVVAFLAIVGQLLLDRQQFVCGQHEDAFNDTSIFDPYPPDDNSEHSKCQMMEVPFCHGTGYNKTMLPNILGHHSQIEIIAEMNIYDPLVRVNCSKDLRLFLCTVYAPICLEEQPDPITLRPCRSLCESARRSCSPALKNFNHEWPPALSCDKFPENGQHTLCVSHEEKQSPLAGDPLTSSESGYLPTRDLGFVCPKNFESSSNTLHLNGRSYSNCALPCDNVLLDSNGAQTVRTIVAILSMICILSTIFACITFIINTKRFKYPARPMIIIAFCQLVVATCYLMGFFTNKRISCNEPAEPPRSLPNLKMVRLVSSGNKKGICTLQFMALYFFQLSTVLWWLMMALSWHMIARLKWAPEAVSGIARYFHWVSWTIPALLTIYLSVLGNIEGDSLSGTCYISTSDQETIRPFVVYPMAICLSLGCLFLISGFKSIWDSREVLKMEYGKQTSEHYKLVIRIGLYSILFIVLHVILILCLNYEQRNLNVWMLSWLSKICNNRDYSIPCPVRDFSSLGPHYITFVLKYGATMAVGIVSALFMMSEKTLNSYREVAELCNYKAGI